MLSPDQIGAYRRDGYSFPHPALAAAELAECREGLARYEAWLGQPVNQGDWRWRSAAYAFLPWLDGLIRHPSILDAVEDLVGPDIMVFTTTFFIKEANSPTFAAWHQDATYFGITPYEHVTAWVALTDATEAAGCMEVVPARGAPRQLRHAALGLKDSINGGGQQIVDEFDQHDTVMMAVPAGGFSLHHPLCRHRHHHRVVLVEFVDDLLAAAVDAVLEAERGMAKLPRCAARRHHLHAAGRFGGVGQRDPGGDVLVGRDAEIGRVLVPGRESGAVRLLDEEGRGEHHDVGPDQILDRIEDARMADQPIEPRQEGIGGGAPAPIALVDRLAEPRLVARQTLAAFRELRGGERRMRKRIAVAPIGADLVRTQHRSSLAEGPEDMIITPIPAQTGIHS